MLSSKTNESPPRALSRANWRQQPQSRWAFRHVDALLPCASIANDPTNVRALVLCKEASSDMLLRHVLLPLTSTDGFVVLARGEIVCERYANGTGPDTRHILMSATKSFVGLLAELLQREGELDVDCPVARVLPELGATPWRGATLRSLIDMRCRVRLTSDQQRAYDMASNWEAAPPADGSGLQAFFAGMRGESASGDGPFGYVSANIDLVGWVIERATGRSLVELLSERIWKPMGAQHPALMTLDAAGAPRCTGGLCATTRDLARLGQWLLDADQGGAATGGLTRALVDDLCTQGDRSAWTNGEWGSAFSPISRNMSYRSGWYGLHDAPQTLFAMGIYGQNLFIDRINRVVVAKTSSWAAPTVNLALWLTHAQVLPRARRLAARSR